MTAKDLKNALLQEAVQGKLVPQIASEGNARDLLEEIRKEKAKLIKEGKIKKEKPLPEITEEEIPFDIPENWCWCRLSEYLDIRDGTHDSPKFYDKGIPFVTSKNLNDGILDFSTCKYITEDDHKIFSARSFVEDGDILFAMIGSIGNPVIVKKEFDFSFKNMALFKRYTKEKTDMKYIFYYLSYIQYELKRIATGGVQSFIGLGTFREMLFPLPPLAEQKRIVAAIEKFMPLIEEYGKKETELKAFNEQIGTLTKKAILQEAVQGKLVPQITAEGNAKDLLEEIKKEKAKLIKEGKIKKEKPLPEITEEEIPFDIPESWCWCRLGDLVPFGVCQNAEPKEINDEDWILDLEDIEKDSGKIITFKTKKDVDSKSTKHIFKKNYVLYSKLRPYLNKCVIAPKDGFCTSEILPLDFGEKIYNRYAQLYLMSPFFVEYTNSLSFGVKMPRLGTEDGKRALFPLPPLKEQKRIITAIEKLLPLCEKLGN